MRRRPSAKGKLQLPGLAAIRWAELSAVRDTLPGKNGSMFVQRLTHQQAAAKLLVAAKSSGGRGQFRGLAANNHRLPRSGNRTILAGGPFVAGLTVSTWPRESVNPGLMENRSVALNGQVARLYFC